MPQRFSLEESLVKSGKLKKCPVDLKQRNLIPTCKREEYYTDRELKKPEVIDNLQPDQRPDVIPPIYTANGIQVLTPRSFQMSNGEIQFLNAIPDDRRRVPRPPMSHEAFLIDYHTDNQQQMHTPSKLPSKIYQQHQQFLQEFRDHPETTNLDIAAAEMSQATYIDDSMLRQEFIENVSTLDRQGWELDRDARTQNDYIKTFVNRNTGDVAVAHRGTVTWTGPDGISNVSNSLRLTRARQLLAKEAGIDFRTLKQRQIQQTLDNIQEKYGDRVKLTTGHSQGGYDSVFSRQTHFQNAKTINFNPAPGGHVAEQNGRSFVTPNDFVSANVKRIGALHGPSRAKVITVKSTGTGMMQTLSGGHLLTGSFAPGAPQFYRADKVEFTEQQIRDALNSTDDSFTSFMRKKNVSDLSTLDVNSPIVKAWQEEHTKMFPESYRQRFPAFSDAEDRAITNPAPRRLEPLYVQEPPPRPSFNARGLAVQTGVSLAVAPVVQHVLNQIGVRDQLTAGTATGAITGMGLASTEAGARALLARIGSSYGARLTGREVATLTARGGLTGGLGSLAAIPVDMAISNALERGNVAEGISGTISGLSSSVVGSVAMAGTEAAFASAAAGELTAGPEMIPIALFTIALGTAIGGISGLIEEGERRENQRVVGQFVRDATTHVQGVDYALERLTPEQRERIPESLINQSRNILYGTAIPQTNDTSQAQEVQESMSAETASAINAYLNAGIQAQHDQLTTGEHRSPRDTLTAEQIGLIEDQMGPRFEDSLLPLSALYYTRARNDTAQVNMLESRIIRQSLSGEVPNLSDAEIQLIHNIDPEFTARYAVMAQQSITDELQSQERQRDADNQQAQTEFQQFIDTDETAQRLINEGNINELNEYIYSKYQLGVLAARDNVPQFNADGSLIAIPFSQNGQYHIISAEEEASAQASAEESANAISRSHVYQNWVDKSILSRNPVNNELLRDNKIRELLQNNASHSAVNERIREVISENKDTNIHFERLHKGDYYAVPQFEEDRIVMKQLPSSPEDQK
jgi:hypothetical protein